MNTETASPQCNGAYAKVHAPQKRTYPHKEHLGPYCLRVDIIREPKAQFYITGQAGFVPIKLTPFRNDSPAPTPEDETDLDAWLDLIRENLANTSYMFPQW